MDKDNKLIWENLQKHFNEVNDPRTKVLDMFNDLFAQKQQHYPGADVSDLYDTTIEDLESEFNERGDEQSLYILQQLHSTGELHS